MVSIDDAPMGNAKFVQSDLPSLDIVSVPACKGEVVKAQAAFIE